MLEYCSVGALDAVIKELDRGLSEEAIKIVTRQALEVRSTRYYLHQFLQSRCEKLISYFTFYHNLSISSCSSNILESSVKI